jgi:ketol-acid reductoisomerase
VVTDVLDLGTVAVLGFGNQGEAHAHNLRDAGVRVRVGARPGGAGESRARSAGFEVGGLAETAAGADLAAVLLPDEAVPGLWPALSGVRPAPRAWLFAHGFNLLYSGLGFDEAQDVLLVSPTAPGRVLRAARARGERIPAYLAVHRDGSGSGWPRAERYAELLGCGPTWRTSVREETEVDLFGEQTVLCGGMNALVTAAFDTLVEAGYSPEIAYLECVHQLRYLAELLHERGVSGMREGISGTALFGDLTRGPRVIGPEARRELGRILEEIRDRTFALEWSEEAAAGRPRTRMGLEAGARHPIERARRRALAGPGARRADSGPDRPRGG